MPTQQIQNLMRFAELPRAGLEMASLLPAAPWLSLAPRGDKHAVVVIPGFMADDDSTALLRRFLTHLGYDVHPWRQGRNLGAGRMGGYEPLVNEVLRIYSQTGQKVSLVGWSLGGVHAVAIAQQVDHAIRQVITLGSPLFNTGESTAVMEALRATARRLNGQVVNPTGTNPFTTAHFIDRIPAPITSVYSRTDGVVPWRRSLLPSRSQRDNIEVRSSHVGLGFNPAVLFAVADRLALTESEFVNFHRNGWRALTYPTPPRERPAP